MRTKHIRSATPAHCAKKLPIITKDSSEDFLSCSSPIIRHIRYEAALNMVILSNETVKQADSFREVDAPETLQCGVSELLAL